MTSEEILAKLDELANINTKDSWEESFKLIQERLKEKISNEEKVELEHRLVFVKYFRILKDIEALNGNNNKEEIHLRGQMIQLLKDETKKEKDENLKYLYRHMMLEELKRHKEVIEKTRKDKNTKISIPEKLGLFLKDIGTTIKIFMEEHDVVEKAKNIIKETTIGGVSSYALLGGVGLAVQLIAGVPLTLTSIVTLFPVLAYTGLSSVIRNVTTKTPFQQYEYHQSEEYKQLVEQFTKEHEAEIQAIEKISQDKKGKSREEKMAINDALIAKLDALSNATNIDGLKQTFQLKALSCYRENKAYCEEIKDDYLEERNDDVEKYKENNARLRRYNLEIFKRGNSIEEAIKNSGKHVVKNAAVMLLAKSILAVAAPNMFAIRSASSILEPLAFAVVNGIIDIPTYKNKLKFFETEYEGIVKEDKKHRIEDILEGATKKVAVSYA